MRTQRPCLHLCDDVPAGWAQLPTWAGLAAAAAGQTRNTRIFTEAVSVNIVSPLQPGPRPARHVAGDRSEGGALHLHQDSFPNCVLKLKWNTIFCRAFKPLNQ